MDATCKFCLQGQLGKWHTLKSGPWSEATYTLFWIFWVALVTSVLIPRDIPRDILRHLGCLEISSTAIATREIST